MMRGAAPRSAKVALEALDEPGAECVEPFEPGQVDVDAARVPVTARGGVDDDLQVGGALGGPRAGRGERQALAVDRAGERGCVQSGALRGGSMAQHRS